MSDLTDAEIDALREDLRRATQETHVLIPRPQYEALVAAKDALVRLHKLTGYVETDEVLAALRAAGIDMEDKP